jgi:uncharacterized membrane protein (UPF0127 family)
MGRGRWLGAGGPFPAVAHDPSFLTGCLMMRTWKVGLEWLRAGLWIALLSWIGMVAPGGAGVHAAEFQPLEIATRAGVKMFAVEMATTEKEKEKGLMYRKHLPDGQGMLFDFSPVQQVSMWMKNTYISLDMIFIGPDGRILRIAENTEPLSTRIIPSRGLAKGVLELIAGTAKKYGIAPGDRVSHPLFNGH